MRIAIIGAGAAGCFAAANISKDPDTEVVVFEKTGKVLQKVKVSGGGRCNVTHSCFDIPQLIDRYPRGKRFLRKTLHAFTPQHTIDWFNQRGVQLKTEEDGRMFPVTNDSQTIIDCLWSEMQKQSVQVRYQKSLQQIEKHGEVFQLKFADSSYYEANKVLVTCGGFPKKEQYRWLEELGHTIEEPVPSLFTFNLPKHPITELMGVSVKDVSVKVRGTKLIETGPILITHWGLSGPAVLKCSAWGARELNNLNYNFTVAINWLTDVSEDNLRSLFSDIRQEKGKQLVQHKNPFELPKRLWEYLLTKSNINTEVRWGELPAKEQNMLINALVNDEYEVKGKTTFKEEFVTAGGIKLSEIEPKTMQSRVVPGLYFAGEIMDVDGVTGGFNFQHAWSSGYIAAQNTVVS